MKASFFLFTAIFFITTSFAQSGKGSSSKENSTFQQMFDYSRPGKYHQMLATLVGSWTFEGNRFELSDTLGKKPVMKLAGKVTRRPFANGRFFIAELTTAAKVELPVQNGKTVKDYGKAIQTEGYNNIRRKFQISYINNHIGSEISFWEGTYDSTTKTITFYSFIEDVPGAKVNSRFDFVFEDKNNYQWIYYLEQNGKYIKDTELDFTRMKEK